MEANVHTLDCGEPCIFCSYAHVAELNFTEGDRRDRIRFCAKCERIWEPEHRANPRTEACNNCAFRKRSPERADADGWAALYEATVINGAPFACHKNMPAELAPGSGYRFKSMDLERDRITYCAGWLAHRRAYVAKALTVAADAD
jgi:hypothetical protein